jgi:hypothetical protein
MTSSGKRIAAICGILGALALPKHVECGYPDQICTRYLPHGRYTEACTPYELEPWGFYLLESVLHRDVGFAYEADEECR